MMEVVVRPYDTTHHVQGAYYLNRLCKSRRSLKSNALLVLIEQGMAVRATDSPTLCRLPING